MKIGLVIYGSIDTLSGGYLYDRMLVEYLRAQGDVVEIICLPLRNYAAHLFDNLSFKQPVGLDILIQDELTHPSLIGVNTREHPCPVVSLVHHLRCSELRPKWQNDLYRIIERKYLQSVNGFIFNSETTRNAVNGLMGKGKPFIVAHPPTDRFGEAVSESEIITRTRQEPFRIIFLGNLMERKGLHTLLNALCETPAAFRLDVVGSLSVEPKYTRKLQRVVASRSLSRMVTFHSSLDNNPLIEILKGAHVLVVPSSYEGFGIVYLEGMGFGLPAIGTTAGAAGEIIDHDQTGYLIRPGDSTALAGHLTSLARDRDLLVRLSLNARKRYIRQPLWRESARHVRAFLQSMIG